MKTDKPTPQNKSEEEQRLNDTIYQQLFNANRDSITIFRFSPDGIPLPFIEANEATTEIFGYTRKDLLTLSIRDIESISEKERKERVKYLIAHGIVDFETIIKNKSGNDRNVEIKSVLIDYHNEPAVMNITRDITERKQNEENARKTHHNLASILEAIPDLLFEVGLDGRIYHYQSHRTDLLAAPPEVFMGKRFQEFLPEHAAKACTDAIEEAEIKGWSTGKQYALELPNGKFWFELSVSPITESNAIEKHFILLARDITERKQAEEKLVVAEDEQRKQFEKTEHLYKLAKLIDNEFDLEKIYNHAMDTLINGLKADRCSILLFDSENIIRYAASRGVSDNFKKASEGHSPWNPGTKNPDPIFVTDVANDPRIEILRAEVITEGIQSFGFIPLIIRGFVIGKFMVFYNTVHTFDESEKQFAHSIAGDIAIALDRKKYEELLIREKDLSDSIINSLPNIFYLFDINGKLLRWNKNFETISGYTSSEITNMNPIDFFDVEDKELIRDKIYYTYQDGYSEVEVHFFSKDKKKTPYFFNGRRVEYNNRICVIGAGIDISERKRANEQLVQQHATLNAILESNYSSIFSLDTKYCYTAFNKAHIKNMKLIYGVDIEIGHSILEYQTVAEDREIAKKNLDRALRGEQFIENEFSGEPGLHRQYFEIVHNPIIDDLGKIIGVSVIALDITNRKQTEHALENEKRRLAVILIGTGAGTWEWNIQTGATIYNDRWAEIIGYTLDEISPVTIDTWRKFTHPDDIPHSEEMFQKHYNGELDYYECEARMQHKNGDWVWVLDRGKINEWDLDGRPLIMSGTHQDITERKLAEKALKDSERKLQGIFNTANSGILLTDKKGKFVLSNKWAGKMLGYTEEEMITLTNMDITYPDDLEKNKLWFDKINKGKVEKYQIEKRYLRKDKSFFWGDLSVSVIKDENNNITNTIGIVIDITERKLTEEKLEENLIKYRGLSDATYEAIFLSENGICIEQNSSAEKMFGYTNEEAIGKNGTSWIIPEDREIVKHNMLSGYEKPYEVTALRKDGSTFPCILLGKTMPYKGKNIRTTSLTNISEHKQAEEELNSLFSVMKATLDSIHNGILVVNYQGTVIKINGKFAEMWQLSEEIVSSKDDKKMMDSILEKLVNPKEFVEKVTELYANPEAVSFDLIYFNDGRIFERISKPLTLGGKTGGRVWSFLDVTDQKLYEEKLRYNKNILRAVLDNVPLGIWMMKNDGQMLFVNKEFCKAVGIAEEQFIAVPHYAELYTPDVAAACIASDLEALKGEGFYLSNERLTFTDGKKHDLEIKKRKIIDEQSGTTSLIGIMQDITERKQTDEKLKLSESRLIAAQSVAKVGSWETDLTFSNIIWSKEMHRIFGVSPDNFQLTLEGFLKMVHPEDRASVEKAFVKSTKTDALNTFEHRIITPSGQIKCVEEHWGFSYDEEEKSLRAIGTCQDISKRKRAEKRQQESLNLIQKITSHLPGVVYQYKLRPDGTSCFPYASQGIKEIYRVTPEEVREDASKVIENIHPEDHDAVLASILLSAENLTPWRQEYRVKFKDGTVRYLFGNSMPQRENDGSVIWHGFITDITDSKNIEDSLRESEEKYRGLVESSPDGILIYVGDKIAFINDEAVRMMAAKSKDELIGKPVMQFIHPDNQISVAQRMKDVIIGKEASETVEERIVSLDGNYIDVELKAIPTIFEHQAAVQVIIHDITERKRSSFELTKINRVYSLISQINNLILRSNNREELFQEICRIAVTYGKFRMSWIGLLDKDKKTISTAAFDGFEDGYFTKDEKVTVLNIPQGRGPTGTAMREGKTIICNDIANDAIMKTFRNDALRRGFRSSITIPIKVNNEIIGTFNLYSDEINSFTSSEEIALLEKITQNVAFTLEAILIEEDRKRTEDKIRQLSQAVEQSPVTIVITDIKGGIEYVNPKFTESTGYSSAEVLGDNPRILKSGHTSPEEYHELWHTLIDGKEWHGEFENRRKDGTFYWESASISPIKNAQGQTTHFIAIKEDITERKKIQKELISAKDKAEESDRLKLAFLANMSHEIRTPMNGILGFTELLKEPHLTGEEQQKYIRIIEKSGVRMLNIINDIISISKVESGQVEVVLSETNVNEQFDYLQTFFKPEVTQKGIQLLVTNQLPAEAAIIKTDKEKLYAILTNLVKNAIKFTDSGKIEFGCVIKDRFLEFYIKDSGSGIPKSQKKIIFERFRQANETVTRTHEGSGLGLAISKAYVEMLDGKIWVESRENKGSTFYFTIPIITAFESIEKAVVVKAPLKEKPENKIKNLKVLIVEDDEISKLLITIAVKPFSKEILKVSTGVDAVEACRNNPDIDLVMMDINMPIMGGYEATKQIRKFNKDLVIIAQTANGMSSDRDDAIAAGCTDYISKPVNIVSLGNLIQKYFEK